MKKYALSNTFEATSPKSTHLLKRCLRYFKPYYGRILLAIISMCIVAASAGAMATLVKPALDDIFINKDAEALVLIPFLLVVVVLTKGIFRFLQNYLMNYCGLKVLETIRNELYTKMICLPVRFFDENQIGMLMSRIINDVMSINLSMPAVIMIFRQILTMAVLIGVLFYRDAYLAFWAVVVLPLAIYPFIYFAKKLRKLSRKNQSKIADISTFLQEIFSGVRVVKAFATEKQEAKRFSLENARLVAILIRQRIMSELSSSSMEIIGAVGMGFVIWYGGSQVIKGDSTPGTFFSFLTALIMLYEPIKKLSQYNLALQRALAGAERVFEVLDSKDVHVEEDGTIPFGETFQNLEFQNVVFSYEGCPTPALKKVSLKVKAGERVAIVGPSGSGKTTLVNMIPRFYLPQEGSIILNGRNLTEYTLASLRLSVGVVSQEPFLFNISVAENIAYGRGQIDMEAVERASRAAFAHDFILEMNGGYDSVIGERGVMLSGGQKQRLTIARALLKDPPLLILDEATSALDTESERIVQLALENLMRDRTSIVIAHRLSTVLSADRIVVMEAGEIIAQGDHKHLLENCPLYANLYEMQFQEPERSDSASCVAP
jgi:ATP-binding cassette, subfamily B, bacterial MsbA